MLPELTKLKITTVNCEHLSTHLVTGDGRVDALVRPGYQLSVTISKVKGKGSPYSIAERRVPELIPVLGSQPAGDVSHKPGGRLPLLSARSAVTLAALKRAATNFAAWRTEARWE